MKKKVVSLIDLKVMKTPNDCEIACDCVKCANVVLRLDLCKEIFARKHTATHKPASAQPFTATSVTYIHTSNNRLWSPYGLGPSGAIIFCGPPWPMALGAMLACRAPRPTARGGNNCLWRI